MVLVYSAKISPVLQLMTSHIKIMTSYGWINYTSSGPNCIEILSARQKYKYLKFSRNKFLKKFQGVKPIFFKEHSHRGNENVYIIILQYLITYYINIYYIYYI